MKIIIACKGRSHLLDCSRELQRLGHDVLFFTGTPPQNFKKYGLKKGGISLTYILAPIILLSIWFPSNFTRALFSYAIDFIVGIFMPKCDIFIGSSPDFSWSMKRARKKFNAKIILDRGASHVRIYNKQSVASGQPSMTEWYMKKDESQYKLVDYIVLGSDYMKEGFEKMGVDYHKLFSNPYGVSFNEFPPTIYTGEYDCIYVGRWSKRKGCKLIIDAFDNTNIKFLHVGLIDDLPFPNRTNFTHIDPVPQIELTKYYAKAKVFIFPTFDDGFGMVLCQAFASGLNIICSRYCGGTTINRIIGNSSIVNILDELTAEALKSETIQILNSLTNTSQSSVRNQNVRYLDKFSWENYAKRYNEFLMNL